MMRPWRDLGMVDTIYEEEEALDSASNSLTASPTASSPSFPQSSSSLSISLQTRVEEWSRATGSKTDVIVCVQDQRFYLHKEPLLSRSGYFKRHLTVPSTVSVSVPSSVTSETFTSVAGFCYSGDVVITPFNVVALRIAAEWLEMTEDDGGGNGDENLIERTEGYFCQAIAASPEYAAIVLGTCLEHLPTIEEAAAYLAGRCIEALAVADNVDGDNGSWLDHVAALMPEEFQVITSSMRPRFAENHEALYMLVDYYLKSHEELKEEEKNRICCAVDCKKLSRRCLIDLVQNPRMPLRFVVQAMLVEQFHTRHSLLDQASKTREPVDHAACTISSATLGAILERDAALRQVAHLKAAMEATSFRIQSLEQDLADMKMQLKEAAAAEKNEMENSVPARSVSLRFFTAEEKKQPEENPKSGKGFGRMLIRGLKNVFRVSSRSVSESRSASYNGDGEVGAAEEIRRQPMHRRSYSFA